MLKKRQIKICLGSSCFSRGNSELVPQIEKYIRQHHLEDKVNFSGDHCCNECLQGPNIRISGKAFRGVRAETIEQILNEELKDL